MERSKFDPKKLCAHLKGKKTWIKTRRSMPHPKQSSGIEDIHTVSAL
jgi:hypothetical protein